MLKGKITTIPVARVQVLLQIVKNTGEKPDTVLSRAGISLSCADLERGIEGIPRQAFTHLFRECIFALEYDTFRRGSVPSLSFDEAQMLCYCIIHRKTLGEVIQQAIKFFEMLRGRGISLSLENEGEQCRFTFRLERNQQSSSALVCDLLALSYYHRLFNWMIGETINVTEVSIAYPELVSSSTLIDLFHYSVAFTQPTNHFCFPSQFLDRPVIRSLGELEEFLTVFPFDLESDGITDSSLADAVYHLIKRRLLKGEAIPGIPQLAITFNLSPTTLRRRLDAEQSSFSMIKEQCRRELAMKLLRVESTGIEEIAARLDFSDAGAFRRAFKKWTGQSPTEYRTHQGGSL